MRYDARLMGLTCEDIARLSHVSLVSLLDEINTPPGGASSIAYIATTGKDSLTESSVMLDVGCCNGFASLEFVRLTGCRAIGIDVNPFAMDSAKRLSAESADFSKVRFLLGDAMAMPFSDGCFDLVYFGGSLSWIHDRMTALAESMRALRRGGLLALVPLYYRVKPSRSLLDEIERSTGLRLLPWTKDYWISLLQKSGFRKPDIAERTLRRVPFRAIESRIERFLNEKAALLRDDVRMMVYERLSAVYKLFEKNNRLLDYAIVTCKRN